MEELLKGLEVLHHSAIKISKKKIIYVDPFGIQEEYHDADYIFCTHIHYDHFSEEDIKKVRKEDTIFIITPDAKEKTKQIQKDETKIVVVKPDQEYSLEGMNFKTVVAYNKEKSFHPKENNWVGYNIIVDDVLYYIAGDTDFTEELENIKCDIAFVPVGGTYTMNAKEATHLVNKIKPKIAIPTHYGSVVGKKEDAKEFVSKVDSDIKAIILLN